MIRGAHPSPERGMGSTSNFDQSSPCLNGGRAVRVNHRSESGRKAPEQIDPVMILSDAPDPETDCAPLARRLIRLRRDREALFGAELFADPAWDILLDLLVAQETGRRVSISSLCIASAVPATTALRFIHLMTSRGLLERYPDDRDRRRHWIRLTPKAYDRMALLLRRRDSLCAELPLGCSGS